MAQISVKQVILIVVALMVIGLILPLGLGMTAIAGDVMITVPFNMTGLNETQLALKYIIDPAVLTLLTVLLPILAVIGIAVAFIPKV